MTVALLSIGTELTRGELVNSNAPWLAERLVELGYEVTEMTTVDDDDARIVAALRDLTSRHDVIVSTGGLGPTTDDRTSACVAAALGVPLERDARSLTRIAERFAKYGIVMNPSNEKQADFPQGAAVLDNDHGTAPGFAVQLGGAICFFTPGVPSEMKHLFEERILPRLPAPPARIAVRKLRTFGMPESQVNDHLAGLEEEFDVTIGYRASHSEIEVKILARRRGSEDANETEARAALVEERVAARLGDVVYGRGNTSLAAVVGELALARGLKIALAESCTGGLVSEMLTVIPGSSAYYQGGVVSYSNTSKMALLGVDAASLAAHGAVSEVVAREMALGAQRVLGAEVALALTGIAGPTGGSEEKPVGLVFWAVATPSGVQVQSRVFRGDRAQIQRRAATAGLWSLRAALLG